MTQGICRNAACPTAAHAVPVDRYPGPGEYCPDCGEQLEPLAPDRDGEPEKSAKAVGTISPLPTPKAFGGLTALEALQQFEAPKTPPPAPRRSRKKAMFIASGAVAVAAIGGLVAFHPAAVGHPSGDALHVCHSSITQRFATDIVAAYRTKSVDGGPRVEQMREGACDVRFSTVAAAEAQSSGVVGRDAVVAVVNPENPLSGLTPNQLRQILSGDVTDWSQIGTGSGPIDVVIPDENTDEDKVLSKQILAGAKLAHTVRRVGSSADVVALVSGTQGRKMVGIASFSGAVPAKVVGGGCEPPPRAR
jgi:hypothetical protein